MLTQVCPLVVVSFVPDDPLLPISGANSPVCDVGNTFLSLCWDVNSRGELLDLDTVVLSSYALFGLSKRNIDGQP